MDVRNATTEQKCEILNGLIDAHSEVLSEIDSLKLSVAFDVLAIGDDIEVDDVRVVYTPAHDEIVWDTVMLDELAVKYPEIAKAAHTRTVPADALVVVK